MVGSGSDEQSGLPEPFGLLKELAGMQLERSVPCRNHSFLLSETEAQF